MIPRVFFVIGFLEPWQGKALGLVVLEEVDYERVKKKFSGRVLGLTIMYSISIMCGGRLRKRGVGGLLFSRALYGLFSMTIL